MKIRTELYPDSIKQLPLEGKHILAHQLENNMVVYQAYKTSIADFALENQYLGGPDFSYARMSWIKPNFLWMMYRCGWAEKENQKRILALWINKNKFEDILSQGIHTSFDRFHYKDELEWKEAISKSEVRIQWDPDHDPLGNSLPRRAIQIGLKGKALENFGKHSIELIEDITSFVKDQKKWIDEKNLTKLSVPIEGVYTINDVGLRTKIGCE